jgi:hypothetical protein
MLWKNKFWGAIYSINDCHNGTNLDLLANIKLLDQFSVDDSKVTVQESTLDGDDLFCPLVHIYSRPPHATADRAVARSDLATIPRQ